MLADFLLRMFPPALTVLRHVLALIATLKGNKSILI